MTVRVALGGERSLRAAEGQPVRELGQGGPQQRLVGHQTAPGKGRDGEGGADDLVVQVRIHRPDAERLTVRGPAAGRGAHRPQGSPLVELVRGFRLPVASGLPQQGCDLVAAVAGQPGRTSPQAAPRPADHRGLRCEGPALQDLCRAFKGTGPAEDGGLFQGFPVRARCGVAEPGERHDLAMSLAAPAVLEEAHPAGAGGVQHDVPAVPGQVQRQPAHRVQIRGVHGVHHRLQHRLGPRRLPGREGERQLLVGAHVDRVRDPGVLCHAGGERHVLAAGVPVRVRHRVHGPGACGQHDGRRGVQPTGQVRPHHPVGGADPVLDSLSERPTEPFGTLAELVYRLDAEDVDELRWRPLSEQQPEPAGHQTDPLVLAAVQPVVLTHRQPRRQPRQIRHQRTPKEAGLARPRRPLVAA